MNKEDKKKLYEIREKLLRISEKRGINFATMDDGELLKWLAFVREHSE